MIPFNFQVFDFSSGQMTQTKAKHLKDSMCQQFGDVFTLCQNVMENSNNAALVSNSFLLYLLIYSCFSSLYILTFENIP